MYKYSYFSHPAFLDRPILADNRADHSLSEEQRGHKHSGGTVSELYFQDRHGRRVEESDLRACFQKPELDPVHSKTVGDTERSYCVRYSSGVVGPHDFE